MAQQWNEQVAARSYGGELDDWITRAPLTKTQVKTAHAWFIVVAVLALTAGLVSIATPIITSVAMSIFIGWVLVLAAVTTGAHAVSRRAPLRGVEAIVTVLAGLYLLIFPLSGTVTLTFVLAVWLFASGVFSLAAAVQAGGVPERGWSAFGGLLSILLGVLIAVELPSSAAWAIGLLVGINLIFWSVRAMFGAHLLKERLQSG